MIILIGKRYEIFPKTKRSRVKTRLFEKEEIIYMKKELAFGNAFLHLRLLPVVSFVPAVSLVWKWFPLMVPTIKGECVMGVEVV